MTFINIIGAYNAYYEILMLTYII